MMAPTATKSIKVPLAQQFTAALAYRGKADAHQRDPPKAASPARFRSAGWLTSWSA